MSKKDLFERVQRPAGDTSRRTEAGGPPVRPEEGGASTTTRVSATVVRRRRKDEPEASDAPAAASERPARRVVQVAETPRAEERRVEERRPERREPVRPEPEAAAPAPVEPVRAEPAKAEPAEVEAPAVESRRAEPAPQAAPKAPKAAPVESAKAAPSAKAQVVAPPPAAEATPAGRQTVASKHNDRELTPRRTPEPGVRATVVQPPPRREGGEPGPGDAERPRYAGLGSAVVVPPPGYDPTNPGAFRAQQERRQSDTGGGWRGGPARRSEAPGSPMGPSGPPGPGAGGDDDRRGRRTRRAPGGGPASAGGPGALDPRGLRRKSRKRVVGPKKSSPAPKAQKRKIRIDNAVSVGQLAKELGVKASVLIRQLMSMDMMVRVNDMLDFDTAQLLAGEFEYEVENVGFQEADFLQHVADEAEEEGLDARPPVVTIMGHVDHGKTTLLDTIRSSRVAAGEAGGITQHIGAYQINYNDELITFVDTPGHAAFSSMRARGAQVTDIVVLVVAADDGVQPQTEEAIAHAKAAGVPIIVAVNKCDKPGVNPDSIKQQLTQYELVPEEWGGETLMVNISALKNENIDGLLESILLQAEVLDLQANADRHAEGVVLEAKMERGRGAVASLLVQKGTLKRGDQIVIGAAFGKVRAMLDDAGKPLKEAGPSTPVEIFGLSELPEVGDAFSVVKSEKDARALAEYRAKQKRDLELSQTNRRTAEDLFAAAGPQNEQLQIVLKADVQGSLEALKAALLNLNVDGAEVRILLAGVGPISESDVNLVAAGNGALIGFNVKLDANARKRADEVGVEAQLFEVIYAALDYVEARMKGLLAPEYEEIRTGSAEIRAVFPISRLGKVAGCYVLDGKIGRNNQARVLRGGKELWKGSLSQLKRFKDDVREVSSGYECGILLDGFDDIEIGDVIETSALQIKARA